MKCRVFTGLPDQVEYQINEFFYKNSITIVSTTQSTVGVSEISVTIIYKIS